MPVEISRLPGDKNNLKMRVGKQVIAKPITRYKKRIILSFRELFLFVKMVRKVIIVSNIAMIIPSFFVKLKNPRKKPTIRAYPFTFSFKKIMIDMVLASI